MIIIEIDEEKINKGINLLAQERNSTKVLRQSLDLFHIRKENYRRKCVFILLEIFVSLVIAQQIETIAITKQIIEFLNGIIVALIAIVFTGYAFFQALINDRLLVALLSSEGNEENKLFESNSYFAKVLMIQIVCLLMNIGVIITTCILPPEWCIFVNNRLNEFIATILLVVVLHINIECIWEMKSFIFNVFQMFNLYAFSKALKIIETDKNE